MGGSKDEDNKIRIKIIEDLLTCQFRATYKNIFFDRSRSSDDRFKSFYNCVGTELHKVDSCLHIIQNLCNHSLVRITKVIRMSVDIVLEILEKIPNLKIIHLLRDPRAIINSLQQMHFHFNTRRKAQILCDYMKQNIIAFEEIAKMYRKQTATVFFESLANDPIGMTEKLYDFIGVATTNNVISWVKKNMHGKHLDTGTYSVKNRNSRAISNKWKNEIDTEDLIDIDAVCKEFYDISGYLEVNDDTQLDDPKIVNFRTNSRVINSDLEYRETEINSLHENEWLIYKLIKNNFLKTLFFLIAQNYESAYVFIVIDVLYNFTATRVQILDETNCISHSTNTLGKGMNPIILPPAMGK